MEIKGVANQITVYDDFAHHPTAIETTIAGLRQKSRQCTNHRRTGAAFQHHETWYDESRTFRQPEEANAVFCYAGGIDWDVQAALEPLGDKLHIGKQFDEICK